ncbi:MAG: hypothetical protein ACKOGP_09040, partial [Bacteroidota bacterium]
DGKYTVVKNLNSFERFNRRLLVAFTIPSAIYHVTKPTEPYTQKPHEKIIAIHYNVCAADPRHDVIASASLFVE